MRNPKALSCLFTISLGTALPTLLGVVQLLGLFLTLVSKQFISRGKIEVVCQNPKCRYYLKDMGKDIIKSGK